MELPRFSLGIGDRFGRQGRAQLAALLRAREAGVTVAPVWNKSHREHTIIGTEPAAVRTEADAAVTALGWSAPYFVDADHIGLNNVDLFIASSDFFTLDVADFTGRPAAADETAAFVAKHRRYVGELTVPGLNGPLIITKDQLQQTAAKYLLAVREAARIYEHIAAAKGEGTFVAEVSMDETDEPQTPGEMLFILAAIAAAGIPARTIAPKFSGRFNKGVDYVGDVECFADEFRADVAVIRFAVEEFGLPAGLKLSVHSGSDKFSLYPIMNRVLREQGVGLHVKTAGTTWLEELVGLAVAGGSGRRLAAAVYREALARFDELCAPYAPVIDIDPAALPAADAVDAWSGAEFAAALRHDPACPAYNLHVRQLLHVAYKVAAEMGDRYLDALDEHERVIADNVEENLFARHLKPIFLG